MTMQFKDADNAAIYQAVTDYYEGWFEADTERMKRCLHPDLAKRAVGKDSRGEKYLGNLTKEQMLGYTREGGGSNLPEQKRHWEITIKEKYEEIAAVTVLSTEYVEYIQLAKQDGQ
jgi:hypothetical protein